MGYGWGLTPVAGCTRPRADELVIDFAGMHLGELKNYIEICCYMNANKKHITPKAKKKSVNPFVKLAEEKRKITAVIKSGKSLSGLNEIKFVKPL